MTRRVLAVSAGIGAVVAIVAMVAIAVNRSTSATQATGDRPVPVQSARIGGDDPGDLVSATTLPQLDAEISDSDIRAAHVIYRSTTGDTGETTSVSGTVFAPGGRPPAGGWPVVAVAHGTTGIHEPCAPSRSPNLLGLTDVIKGFSALGYAVALPDYQGLGAPGVHPYGDARTIGFNVIDSVRALRATFPDVSPRWAGFGQSQGGGAVWAANEQAEEYAPELELVGTAALSPPPDVVGLVAKAQRGALTQQQGLVLRSIIESLGRLHADLDLDDYRSGSVAENWDVLSACTGPDVAKRAEVAQDIGRTDLRPRTAEAAATLKRYLQEWSLPQGPLTAPLSVVYADQDELIDHAWTSRAIDAACRLGGTVQADLMRGRGHAEVDVAPQVTWIVDRFAGKKVADDCDS